MPIMVIIEVFIVVGLAFLFTRISKRNNVHKNDESEHRIIHFENNIFPYNDKLLLTQNEHNFFVELKKITDRNGFIICPKVSLKNIFDITNKSNYMVYLRKISQSHVDFLICDCEMLPKYAIDIVEASQVSEAQQEATTFKNKLFHHSKVELIHIPAAVTYAQEDIQRALKLPPVHTDAPRPTEDL